MGLLRTFAATLGAASLLVLAAGFLGPLHRAGDSLALLRPLAGAGCLLGLVAGPRALRLACAAGAVLAAATVLPPLRPQAPGGDLRLYSKNLLAGNAGVEAIAADVEAAAPDVVLLQEVSDANRAVIERLAPGWPHVHLCRFSARTGIAVLSRHPFDGAPRCTEARAMALAPVALPGGTAWVASVHLPWPWPVDSAAAEAQAVAALAALEGPAVVAGDFNAFPWTHRVRAVARAARARPAGPTRATFHLGGRLPLPIDHVLAPGGGRVGTRPRLGGDHLGLVADVDLDRD